MEENDMKTKTTREWKMPLFYFI